MLNLEFIVFFNKRRNFFGLCFLVFNVVVEVVLSIKVVFMVFIVKFFLFCIFRLFVIFFCGLNIVKVDEVKYGNLCC